MRSNAFIVDLSEAIEDHHCTSLGEEEQRIARQVHQLVGVTPFALELENGSAETELVWSIRAWPERWPDGVALPDRAIACVDARTTADAPFFRLPPHVPVSLWVDAPGRDLPRSAETIIDLARRHFHDVELTCGSFREEVSSWWESMTQGPDREEARELRERDRDAAFSRLFETLPFVAGWIPSLLRPHLSVLRCKMCQAPLSRPLLELRAPLPTPLDYGHKSWVAEGLFGWGPRIDAEARAAGAPDARIIVNEQDCVDLRQVDGTRRDVSPTPSDTFQTATLLPVTCPAGHHVGERVWAFYVLDHVSFVRDVVVFAPLDP